MQVTEEIQITWKITFIEKSNDVINVEIGLLDQLFNY